MSMHLEGPWLSTTGKRRTKPKFASAEHKRQAEEQTAADSVQLIFAETLPYIPLLTPDDVWAWRSELLGFAPQRGDLYPLYDGLRWSSEQNA